MIDGMIDEIQTEYARLLREATDTDDYQVELVLMEDQFIRADTTEGKCGGVVLASENKLIICSNTLNERLNLCYEETLPELRAILFPKVVEKK
jgi:hypothetical protein